MKIENCPSCGNSDPYVKNVDCYVDPRYAVICPDCDMQGPTSVIEDMAIGLWNRLHNLMETEIARQTLFDEDEVVGKAITFILNQYKNKSSIIRSMKNLIAVNKENRDDKNK